MNTSQADISLGSSVRQQHTLPSLPAPLCLTMVTARRGPSSARWFFFLYALDVAREEKMDEWMAEVPSVCLQPSNPKCVSQNESPYKQHILRNLCIRRWTSETGADQSPSIPARGQTWVVY